jgi:hypothetical protein
MEITKEEVEKLLGYEILGFKVTKKAYRGKKVSSMTIAVRPKKEPEHIVVTIKPSELSRA